MEMAGIIDAGWRDGGGDDDGDGGNGDDGDCGDCDDGDSYDAGYIAYQKSPHCRYFV